MLSCISLPLKNVFLFFSSFDREGSSSEHAPSKVKLILSENVFLLKTLIF